MEGKKSNWKFECDLKLPEKKFQCWCSFYNSEGATWLVSISIHAALTLTPDLRVTAILFNHWMPNCHKVIGHPVALYRSECWLTTWASSQYDRNANALGLQMGPCNEFRCTQENWSCVDCGKDGMVWARRPMQWKIARQVRTSLPAQTVLPIVIWLPATMSHLSPKNCCCFDFAHPVPIFQVLNVHDWEKAAFALFFSFFFYKLHNWLIL